MHRPRVGSLTMGARWENPPATGVEPHLLDGADTWVLVLCALLFVAALVAGL